MVSYQMVFEVRRAKVLGNFKQSAKLQCFDQVLVSAQFGRELLISIRFHASKDFDRNCLQVRLGPDPAQDIEPTLSSRMKSSSSTSRIRSSFGISSNKSMSF